MKKQALARTLLGAFGGLFFTLSARAELRSEISVEQQSQALQFTVNLTSSEATPLQLDLSSEAKILHRENLKALSSQDPDLHFQLAPASSAQLVYLLPLDLSQNVFLSEDDLWHPSLKSASSTSVPRQIFLLKTSLLPGYSVIHSATGQPQDSLALVFGRFTEYSSSDQRIHIHLIQADPVLAKTLIDKLSSYLKQFEAQYGPYPYDQFSVVESADEVGYAFPRMTWLGSMLLRFPFILTSSLPHELLHSWWGNGVFVDYRTGNWCEGFTVFGADYGVLSPADKKIYRLKAITNYLDYVKQSNEISLAQFSSRGEDLSLQAIGYNKALMVLIMLEQQVGADVFAQAQRIFYQKYKFKTASYDDFFAILKKLSGQDFAPFKKFWIEQTGILDSSMLTAHDSDKGWLHSLDWQANTTETAKIPAWTLPVNLQEKNGNVSSLNLKIRADGQGLEQKEFSFWHELSAYSLDPDFLLFRQLSDDERPVEFSEVFGAPQVSAVGFDDQVNQALQNALSNSQVQMSPGPADFSHSSQPVVMSFTEALREPLIMAQLQAQNISWQGQTLHLQGQNFDLSQNSAFVSLRVKGPQNASSIVVLIQLGAQQPSLRWLQRWTHYGANSYLVMSPQGAALQGLWTEPFWQKLSH